MEFFWRRRIPFLVFRLSSTFYFFSIIFDSVFTASLVDHLPEERLTEIPKQDTPPLATGSSSQPKFRATNQHLFEENHPSIWNLVKSVSIFHEVLLVLKLRHCVVIITQRTCFSEKFELQRRVCWEIKRKPIRIITSYCRKVFRQIRQICERNFRGTLFTSVSTISIYTPRKR